MNQYSNISLSDQFGANITYVCSLVTRHIRAVLAYRKVYRNYSSVILHMLKKEYPIKAMYRQNGTVTIHNRNEASIVTRLAHLGCQDCQIVKSKVIISSYNLKANKKIRLEFYDALFNGDLIGIYFGKIYDFLPVQGRTVIDIGANIGDSCVYFALNNAARIIGIEPFPRSYESAKKNIDINGFSDKIVLRLAGCADETGDITIDPMYESKGCTSLEEFKQGIKVPLTTLRDILTQNKVSQGEAVLKMDCEGCEYETILSATADTLRFFTHIQLEYHFGYKNLKEKLEKCGFQVSVTRPLWEHLSSIQGKKMGLTGYLYAIRVKQNMVNNLT